jgi:hypothetical protein
MMVRKRRRKQTNWKAKPGQPIKIGRTLIRVSRAVTLGITAVETVKRVHVDIDDAPPVK